MRGKGTILYRYNGATYDEIGKVFNITGGVRSRDDIEDDSFLNSSETYKTKAPGSKSIGDLSFEVAWNPAQGTNAQNHDLLTDDYNSDAEGFYKIKYPNTEATGEIIHCFVHEIGDKNVLPDETVRLPVVLRPTGRGYTLADAIDSQANPTLT